MRLLLFALFIVLWSAVAYTFYYKKTNKGRKQSAYDSLEEAQTVSEMADAHLRAAKITKAASDRIAEEAAIKLTF